MAGRKSLKEEIKIVERLTALSEPTFEYINAMYLAGEKADKKWAVEQMMKLYAKCIPTELTSDPNTPLVITVAKEVADKHEIDTISSDNSEIDPQV